MSFYNNVLSFLKSIRHPAKIKLEKTRKDLQSESENRKIYEAQLDKKSHELQNASSEMERFIYIASHDLQEPLRKINSFSDRLQQMDEIKINDTAVDYLRRMSKAAMKMSGMIEKLLMYSRVTSHSMIHGKIDTGKLILKVLNDLRPEITRKGAVINFENVPKVNGDQSQLYYVFYNLISNSLRFCDPAKAPLVKIAAQKREDMVDLIITDNGIGFEGKYSELIFQPFCRIQSEGIHEGSGMGLAIAKKIINLHGGVIYAESSPGNGSKFHFSLKASPIEEEKNEILSIVSFLYVIINLN